MQRAVFLLLAVCSISAAAQLPRSAQKNHPVTIVQQTTTTRTLEDGTHITTVRTENYYRSSDGIYRTETLIPQTAPQHGFFRSSAIINMDTGDVTHWVIYDDRPEASGIGHQNMRSAATQQLQQQAQKQQDARPKPESKREDLGLGEVSGYPCARNRFTTTYPINYSGNDKAYTVVQEQCVSADYGVLTQTSEDPFGNGVTTLQSLTPGEPDASYFQPPANLKDSSNGMQ
jgi:hypothetical protein